MSFKLLEKYNLYLDIVNLYGNLYERIPIKEVIDQLTSLREEAENFRETILRHISCKDYDDLNDFTKEGLLQVVYECTVKMYVLENTIKKFSIDEIDRRINDILSPESPQFDQLIELCNSFLITNQSSEVSDAMEIWDLFRNR